VRPDAQRLNRFYSSGVGLRVARAVRARIAPLWNLNARTRLLGLGYCAPFVAGLTDACERVALGHPARQGVDRWPVGAPNRAVLLDDLALPFHDALFDVVLCVHLLDFGDPVRHLREIWRVLAPGGQLILVLANRSGVWTHFDASPFGAGRPFTPSQITVQLEECMFGLRRWDTCLVMPPRRWLMPLEPLAYWLAPELGGLMVIDAEKLDGPAAIPAGGKRLRVAQPAPTI